MVTAKYAPSPAPTGQGAALGWLKCLSLAAVLAAFLLVVLGGIVRVTGSGLGCPDWPLCHGRLVPPLEFTAIIEYTHRFTASVLVSPLVLAAAALVWVRFRTNARLLLLASLSVVLLLGQAALGGVTVLQELPPAIVAAHLALAQAFMACLVLLAVAAFRYGEVPQGEAVGGDSFPRLAVMAVVALYVLLLSGAFVTASGATAACLSWPMCRGLALTNGPLSHIHMLHREAALIVGLFLFYVYHLAFRGRQRPPSVRRLGMAAAAAFVAQVLVGALTVLTGFPIAMMALHLAAASAVWVVTVAMTGFSFPVRMRAAIQRPSAGSSAHA
ncbi:MAG: heme A synthase [SAR202 cluster bacterium]|nr:heme A synthase [SAR202 cluster bacterium]